MFGLTKEQIDSFKWRVWNTIKAPLVAVGLGVVIKLLADIVDAHTITVLFSWAYWDSILVTVAEILGGLLAVGGFAGADKVVRMK